MDKTHQHVYEIISAGKNSLGHVWWNATTKKIESDDQTLLGVLRDYRYGNISFKSGPEFLTHLGSMLTNGYLHARKVEE